ncbi:MAG: hypothetical protein ACR2IE_11095 [Candidatus Sumerlaeaceae bacterium]
MPQRQLTTDQHMGRLMDQHMGRLTGVQPMGLLMAPDPDTEPVWAMSTLVHT